MGNPIIRFHGLAKSSNETNKESIEKYTGYALYRDGDDWVVYDNDTSIIAGPRDVFSSIDKPYRLISENYDTIAEKFVKDFLVPEFEENLKPPKETILVSDDYGINSELKRISIEFFFTQSSRLQSILRQKVLPFMQDKLGASFVCPVGMDVKYQQAKISFAKISHLASIHGIDATQKLVFEKKALDSILPKSLDMFSLIDALIVSTPIATAIPLHRAGSSLYFLRDKPWVIHRTGATGFFEQALNNQEPISDRISFNPIFENIKYRDTKALFSKAVIGANSLLRYLNDPRTFLQNGEFAPALVIESYSSLRLLIADLLALNYTLSSYLRQKIAFSFLDKMANLIWGLTGKSSSKETDIFKRLLSLEMGKHIASTLKYHFRSTNEKLGALLHKNILKLYEDIHKEIGKHLGADNTEENRLNLIRTLRNLTHGTYLLGDKFEKHFYTGAPVVPSGIVAIPFCIMWAFTLEPNRILK